LELVISPYSKDLHYKGMTSKERDLKEYIVKLNDRNIQRQRETGFTMYAILGAVIYCLLYTIDKIDTAIKIFNDSRYLEISVFASDATFSMFLLILSFGISSRQQRLTKIFPYKRPLQIDIADFPIFLILAIICFLNFFLLQDIEQLFKKFCLWFFGILTGLNIISPFVINLVGIYRRWKKEKKGKTVEEIDFTMFNKKIIRIASLSYLLYATLLLSLLFGAVSFSRITIEPNEIVKLIKYSLIFYSLLYLIKLFIDLKEKEHENNRLEDFEKEIFFDNISNDEIVKKFEKDFDGIPFSKWIIVRRGDIKTFFDQQKQQFLDQEILMIEVDQIDKKSLPFEHSGRLRTIIRNQQIMLNQASDFVQRLSNVFSNLKNFSSLNDDELNTLNFVQQYLNQNIATFNNLYRNLANQIIARQTG
jgi:hypothetical protein